MNHVRIVNILTILLFLAMPGAGLAQSSIPLPPPPPPSSSNIIGGQGPASSIIPNNISINMGSQGDPTVKLSTGIKILILMTVLTLAPSILIMTTSFVRILIVLSFIQRALGLQNVPPMQVVAGMSLFLTLFVMMPTFLEIKQQAVDPYLARQIDEKTAMEASQAPMREFMFNQTRKKDLMLFLSIAQIEDPQTRGDVPTFVLIPAFLISELKTAFTIGFIIYVPFLVIDMVIASLLLSMGMMMLPPVIISLPFKIILFVLVDGWNLIIGSLVQSFST